MKKKLGVAVLVIVLLVVGAIYARSRYRDSRYWQYDDYRWNCDADFHCYRGRSIGKISEDLNKLMHTVNRSPKDPESFRAPEDKEPWRYPPKVKILRQRGGTLDVEIVNDFTLTQSMGTTGAAVFIAECTFTLTEHPNIRYINFIFEEGDHALPGQRSREDCWPGWEIMH